MQVMVIPVEIAITEELAKIVKRVLSQHAIQIFNAQVDVYHDPTPVDPIMAREVAANILAQEIAEGQVLQTKPAKQDRIVHLQMYVLETVVLRQVKHPEDILHLEHSLW